MDGFQYKDNVLEFFPTAEGYVQNENGVLGYVFQYKDHLGNVRVSYKRNAQNVLEIVEENNYYAFGLLHKGYNHYVPRSVKNLYKYNGKELQDELGLGMYDYGARNYDPALGRWMNIDPLAELSDDLTPYHYANNNPIFFIDPDGRSVEKSSNNFETVYKDTKGNVVLDTDDGSDDIVIVPDAELKDFKELVDNTDPSIYNSKGWNDHFKSEFLGIENPDEMNSLLDRFTTQWSRQKAINYLQNPTTGNALAMAYSEAISQWTDPQQVVGAASGLVMALRPKASLHPTEAYNRRLHYGRTPTRADRKFFNAGKNQVVDHTTELVKHYYEGAEGSMPGHTMTSLERKAFASDRSKMQLQTATESNSQGGKASAYSKSQKKKYGL